MNNKLADLVRGSGNSIEHYAKLWGLKVRRMEKIMRGEITIDRNLAHKINEEFGVPTDYWMGKKGAKTEEATQVG